MEIRNNMATVLKFMKKRNNLTLTELADELGISRSQLQVMLKGEANPRIDTVEQIANRLNIAPEVLVTADFNSDQVALFDVILELLDAIAILPKKNRAPFVELFIKMAELLRDTDE